MRRHKNIVLNKWEYKQIIKWQEIHGNILQVRPR